MSTVRRHNAVATKRTVPSQAATCPRPQRIQGPRAARLTRARRNVQMNDGEDRSSPRQHGRNRPSHCPRLGCRQSHWTATDRPAQGTSAKSALDCPHTTRGIHTASCHSRERSMAEPARYADLRDWPSRETSEARRPCRRCRRVPAKTSDAEARPRRGCCPWLRLSKCGSFCGEIIDHRDTERTEVQRCLCALCVSVVM